MSEAANPLRGEVDIDFEGESFVLRPAWEAVLEVEKLTGKSAVLLATAAQDGEMTAGDAAIVTTAFIQAWGRQTDNATARGVNAARIGELIQERGLMQVQLRLALVLTNAVTGGCKADGTPKGEAMATGTTDAILAADLQD